MGLKLQTNVELIRATYEGAPADNARHLAALFTPETCWTEAAGFPYAGTFVGLDAITHMGLDVSGRNGWTIMPVPSHLLVEGVAVV